MVCVLSVVSHGGSWWARALLAGLGGAVLPRKACEVDSLLHMVKHSFLLGLLKSLQFLNTLPGAAINVFVWMCSVSPE